MQKRKELEIKLKVFQITDIENHKKMENTGEQTHKRHNTNPSLVPKRHQRNGGKEIIKEISDFPKTEQPIFRLKGPGKYLAH